MGLSVPRGGPQRTGDCQGLRPQVLTVLFLPTELGAGRLRQRLLRKSPTFPCCPAPCSCPALKPSVLNSALGAGALRVVLADSRSLGGGWYRAGAGASLQALRLHLRGGGSC